MGFLRQEHWSEYSFSSPGALPDPGIEPMSPALQADSLTFEPPFSLSYTIHLTCISFVPSSRILNSQSAGLGFVFACVLSA